MMVTTDIRQETRMPTADPRELTHEGAAAGLPSILLVDDRPAAADHLAAFLTDAGYCVYTARSREATFDLFLRERPGILLVDHATMQANGEDLMRCARLVDGRVAIILQCGALDSEQRRCLIRDLQLHGIHHREDDFARLLELLESATASIRRIDDARATQELRGLILTKLCHELRSTLHVIRGYTDMLRSMPAADSAESLAPLGMAADTALRLAQDYLELARLDAPGVALCREAVNIDALLADLGALGRRQVDGRPVRLVTKVPFSGAVICTDGEKLRAILLQLVSNATKFTLSGEIRLAVHLQANRTHFVVADTGPGIERSELPNIFRPFRQLRDAAAATLPGQGVGLAIALRLSEILGASLSVASEENVGAVFTLSLPVGLSYRDDGSAPTLH
jgi:signal transduction histidine kinase